ncbi:MAG: hypothetical protein JJT75_06910 [Opitutales bacterium]|nr:hypothetical protein [Opitutales bacterium]MCH8539681.1 hypothetical protein [Opitutales bacterium]
MPVECPQQRRYLGYSIIFISLLIIYGLWLWVLWQNNSWYDSGWIYLAKMGSHGAVFALVIIHAVLSPGEIRSYAFLSVWHGLWAGMGLSAYVYIRFLYRRIGPLYLLTVS